MARVRDAERTRAKILAAAIHEFSAKGFAGARVDVISRRARTNKQLLYHYFGDKRALFEAAVRHILAGKARRNELAPPDVENMLAFFFANTGADRDWLRLLLWEALSYGERHVPGETERCEGMKRGVARVADAQAGGALPEGVRPEALLLALISLATFPWAFPQVTRMLTGAAPSDRGFQQEYIEVLRTIARRLGRAVPHERRSAPRATRRQPRGAGGRRAVS